MLKLRIDRAGAYVSERTKLRIWTCFGLIDLGKKQKMKTIKINSDMKKQDEQ
jgi:hypothetical protein